MMRILHITPHMGGGVGKALAGLVTQAAHSAGVEHVVACLENPQKDQFIKQIIAVGCLVKICPTDVELSTLVEWADIVQLEFWNHPATLHILSKAHLPEMRLLLWCHVSGLYFPCIPVELLKVTPKFIFTSACSLESPEVKLLNSNNLAVVSSGGGLDQLPLPSFTARDTLRVGYVGSLNFAKLHPHFIDFLAAVPSPDFQVRLIGDETNRSVLLEQCNRLGKPNLLEFRGYTTDIASELAELDVVVYLLNPKHYGTAENALLEAMAMGVVPIVLDQPAERCIVQHHRTGLIIHNPSELAFALDWLTQHEEGRRVLSTQAAEHVREYYSYVRMETAFNEHYRALLNEPKSVFPFRAIFGDSPADWFRAFCRDKGVFADNGEVYPTEQQVNAVLLEPTKGSVFHFYDYFPEDAKLRAWASHLNQYIT